MRYSLGIQFRDDGSADRQDLRVHDADGSQSSGLAFVGLERGYRRGGSGGIMRLESLATHPRAMRWKYPFDLRPIYGLCDVQSFPSHRSPGGASRHPGNRL